MPYLIIGTSPQWQLLKSQILLCLGDWKYINKTYYIKNTIIYTTNDKIHVVCTWNLGHLYEPKSFNIFIRTYVCSLMNFLDFKTLKIQEVIINQNVIVFFLKN